MNDELHIISLIVHAMPKRKEEVSTIIITLPNAQIHGSDANGKMVVTLEAPTSVEIVDQIGTIKRIHGVISVTMVYQHVESLESLNAEINHADYQT